MNLGEVEADSSTHFLNDKSASTKGYKKRVCDRHRYTMCLSVGIERFMGKAFMCISPDVHYRRLILGDVAG